MSYRKGLLEDYRAWLLNPKPLGIEPNELLFADVGADELGKHNWAGEKQLNDVHQYSYARTQRIIGIAYRLPTTLVTSALRQMFRASDYLLPIPGEYDALLLGSTHEFPEDIYLSHLARNGSLLRLQEQDLEEMLHANLPATPDSRITKMQATLPLARAERDGIYRERLRTLLTAAEYGEALTLQPSIREALYPAATETGEGLYKKHLINTGAYTPFVHYDNQGELLYPVVR